MLRRTNSRRSIAVLLGSVRRDRMGHINIAVNDVVLSHEDGWDLCDPGMPCVDDLLIYPVSLGSAPQYFAAVRANALAVIDGLIGRGWIT